MSSGTTSFQLCGLVNLDNSLFLSVSKLLVVVLVFRNYIIDSYWSHIIVGEAYKPIIDGGVVS